MIYFVFKVPPDIVIQYNIQFCIFKIFLYNRSAITRKLINKNQ